MFQPTDAVTLVRYECDQCGGEYIVDTERQSPICECCRTARFMSPIGRVDNDDYDDDN